MKCPNCGRTKSIRHKRPFTKESLAQHLESCQSEDESDFELTDMVACEDDSDGVYFALAWEFGEL